MSYSDDEIKTDEDVDEEDVDVNLDSELDDVVDNDLVLDDEEDLIDDGFGGTDDPEY